MSTKKDKELDVVQERSILTATNEEMVEFKEMIEENTDGELGFKSFEQIKVPSGGMIFWSLLDENGEEISEKSFEGVIITKQKTRAYWPKKEGDNEMEKTPTCHSFDGITGSKYGDCKSCPYSKFTKEGKKNIPPVCKERQLLYVLRKGAMLPAVLNVPRTSIKHLKDYGARLLSMGKRMSGVITKFELVKAQSADGQDYSEIRFSMQQPLNKEEAKIIRESFIPLIENVQEQMGQMILNEYEENGEEVQ
jgi:hypothetical protein